jgi:hypothetical protein
LRPPRGGRKLLRSQPVSSFVSHHRGAVHLFHQRPYRRQQPFIAQRRSPLTKPEVRAVLNMSETTLAQAAS